MNSDAEFWVPEADDRVDRAAHVFGLAESWLFGDAMRDLLAAVGGQLPGNWSWDREADEKKAWLRQNGELPEWAESALTDPDAGIRGLSRTQTDVLRRVLAVEYAAAPRFDFRTPRNGSGEHRERAQAAVGDYDEDLRERILKIADRLGLVSPRLTRYKRYDKTLILGGGYRSPLLRTRYAAQLKESGIELGELSFLGSPRFLISEPAERPVTDEYAPGAADEFDLMKAAAASEFGLSADPTTFVCGCASAEAPCPAWRHGGDADVAARTPSAYTHERRVGLRDAAGRLVGDVYSASSSRPPLRPNTSDTFVMWARCADPRPKQRVLVVTTQVFVPFQSFDGVRRLYLEHGMDIDAVGMGAEWGDRPQTAEYVLQETLSAIRSSRRLVVDAAEVLARAV